MDELRLELHDAHVRDKLRHDRQELQDWQDYKKSLDDPGQRKTRLESMLQRDVSEEYQQQQTAAAQVKQQTEDSKTRLRLREETLKNAPATGIEKNVTDAEIAVSSATVAREAVVLRMQSLRGDFPEHVDPDAPAIKGSSDLNGRVLGADTVPQAAPVTTDSVAPVPTIEAASAVPDSPAVALPKAKRANPFAEVQPYLRKVYKNGKFKTTAAYIRELENQSGKADSPFKESGKTDDAFFLKEGGDSISNSIITDRMRDIR